MADVLWITSTLFAAVFSSFEEGDTPKFQLISAPVSYFSSLYIARLHCSIYIKELIMLSVLFMYFTITLCKEYIFGQIHV